MHEKFRFRHNTNAKKRHLSCALDAGGECTRGCTVSKHFQQNKNKITVLIACALRMHDLKINHTVFES